MKKTFLLLLIVLFHSCETKTGGESNKRNELKDTSRSPGKKAELKYEIEGIWAESLEENPWFKIEGDSIMNIEHGDKMKFIVSGDTLLIDYGNDVGWHLIIKLTEDSLVLKNRNGSLSKLYRSN